MTASPATPLSSLEETDKLLHKFEIANIPDQYRAYYDVKRNNFFASIQGFPQMWQYHLRLDAIWMREFTDLQSAGDATRMFPLLLYFNACQDAHRDGTGLLGVYGGSEVNSARCH